MTEDLKGKSKLHNALTICADRESSKPAASAARFGTSKKPKSLMNRDWPGRVRKGFFGETWCF
jgi:hypothetical protein